MVKRVVCAGGNLPEVRMTKSKCLLWGFASSISVTTVVSIASAMRFATILTRLLLMDDLKVQCLMNEGALALWMVKDY
jgi:hypothetical protein